MTESTTLLLPSKHPTGSEWRRWDLHIHTPCSELGAAFQGVSWTAYLDALESEAAKREIAVIGVTDYMSIDGYEKLLEAKDSENRLKTVQLLVPNIEFRIMPSTTDGKAMNLHLLVDPSAPDHVARIKRALSNLRFEYNGETYGCERSQLIEFSRAQRTFANDAQAFRYGIEQFKPDRTTLKTWLEKEAWLRDNCLIGIANGKDGISGLPLDGFGAIRDEVLRWCHFVFSGNPSDRTHYLGKKERIPPSEIIKQYGTLKPCVHGSDAHDLANLFRPDQDRFCWIKSDPTFHGLRQILWEPEDRVHIGTVPPRPTDQSQLISRVRFEDTAGWFSQDSLDLNPGLVAIIGEKGSGKTAIADLMALAAGVPCDPKSQSSFITKGSLHLSNVKVKLDWRSGTETSAVLPDQPFSAVRPLARYLSQDFVERLCSSDHEGHDLQLAIEEVVFAHLDEVQKEGYSSFSDLRAARESASNTRRERFRGELATSHKEIERLQIALGQRSSKETSKFEAEKQATELKKQLPDAAQLVDQKVLEQLQEQQSLLSEIETTINSKTRRRRVIEDTARAYIALREKVSADVEELVAALREEGMPAEIVSKLAPTWNPAADRLLGVEVQKIDSELTQLKGSGQDADDARTVQATSKRIAALKEQISKDEVSRKRLLDLQKQIAERTATTERLAKEIENLDKRVTQQLAQKQSQRLDLYLKFFSALKEDEAGLRDLYAPMQQAIEKIEAGMKFEIAVGFQIDFRPWIEKAARFFDGRRTGAEDKRKEIERFVEVTLVPAWKKGDVQEIRSAFEQFVNLVDATSFMEKFASQRLSLVELYDWLFSVDHIALSYKVRYGGTELEYLSPGTRGIALLVLYLLMDEDDTRPLIIDQPEGNLDNSSVYQQLVPYIRKAKTRRQIILITHNPNLVVATDAEQVIIATAERPASQPYPRMTYHAGSLEHVGKGKDLGVREAVCLLLEGGKQAFREREHRYALSEE
jgi:energy-coupling factor transporter ATP-binding protein EcfA2